MNPLQIISRVGDLVVQIASGTSPLDVAERLVSIGLDLVPVDVLQGHLTAQAKARANLVADAAEIVKFGETSSSVPTEPETLTDVSKAE